MDDAAHCSGPADRVVLAFTGQRVREAPVRKGFDPHALPANVVRLVQPGRSADDPPVASTWSHETLVLVCLMAALSEEKRELIDYHTAWLPGRGSANAERAKSLVAAACAIADNLMPSERALKLHRKARRKAVRP